MPDRGFIELDHTADIALEFFAPTEEELVIEGARAIVHVLTGGSSLRADARKAVLIPSKDPKDRLVRWLNEVLYLAIVHGFLVASGTARFAEDGLEVEARGEGDAGGKIVTELKGVTYHDVFLDEIDGRWVGRVVVDV